MWSIIVAAVIEAVVAAAVASWFFNRLRSEFKKHWDQMRSVQFWELRIAEMEERYNDAAKKAWAEEEKSTKWTARRAALENQCFALGQRCQELQREIKQIEASRELADVPG